MNKPRYWLLARFAFWVKCLEFPLDPQLHSLRASLFNKAFFFVLYEMARAFKARIDLQSNRNCYLKGFAGF